MAVMTANLNVARRSSRERWATSRRLSTLGVRRTAVAVPRGEIDGGGAEEGEGAGAHAGEPARCPPVLLLPGDGEPDGQR